MECAPSFGNQQKPKLLNGEGNAEGKEDDIERKKPNYLERKPSYFDEEKGERLTRNKTREATFTAIGTLFMGIRAPL